MHTQLPASPSIQLRFQSKRQPKADKANTSVRAKTKREAVIGEIYRTNNGSCKVLDYRDTLSVQVEFLVTGSIVWCNYGNLIKGNIKDPYHPTVYGVGYLGTSNAHESGKTKKSYTTWINMLNRCYNTITQSNQPTYKGVEVNELWWDYSIFEEWFNRNLSAYSVETALEIDSDLIPLARGLFKEYGPDTCLLIPSRLNMQISRLERYLTEIDAYRISDKLPAGMHYDRKAGYFVVELNKQKKRFRPYNLDTALNYLRARRIQLFKEKSLSEELPEDVRHVIQSLRSTSSKA